MQKPTSYYVPEQSKWPIVGSIALAFTAVGAVRVVQGASFGIAILALGFLILTYMLFGWFKNVIDESMQGLYSEQLDESFRLGMLWFIFTEVMFFVICFAAFFYVRFLTVPWLGGAGSKTMTNTLLWPNFQAAWPLLVNPNPSLFPGPTAYMHALGLPLINTLILVSSSISLTIAHKAIIQEHYKKVVNGLIITVLLALVFVVLQGFEYYHAYKDLGLTLNSGIYGTTFFLLTGFHGIHVIVGSIMLIVILLRAKRKHFSQQQHFAFNAAAWYWHFVDVVWLVLFCVVYLL